MRIGVFLLALSFALASRTQSKEPENVRRSSGLRTMVEKARAAKQSTSERRSDDRITERRFQYCGPNEVIGEFGRCERAHVTKNVYAFTAPKYRRPILPARFPQPKLDLNVVFVKTAPNNLPPLPLVVPPTEQKTVVYLLNKKPHFNRQLIEVPNPGPSEPEVFFVNYGSGENPSLPGGIDLQTALRQAPLTGHIVSSPPTLRSKQSGFIHQPVQDFSVEDNHFQGNFVGQSSVQLGVLPQTKRHNSGSESQSSTKREDSAEANHQLSPSSQFQSLSSNKLGPPSSGQFRSPPSTRVQSLPSIQLKSPSSNLIQSAPSNLYQSPIRDSFESDSILQQIPYSDHLFQSTSKHQFDSLSVLFSASRDFSSDHNSDSSYESSQHQVPTRNEFGPNGQIIAAQKIYFDQPLDEYSNNPPANQYETPLRAPSFQSAPSRQYESPSNSLIQTPERNVQQLQPSQFGHTDDDSYERASVKNKINSLPSGFVPNIPSQSTPKKVLPSRPPFKPSQSLPNRQYESRGSKGFSPVPGSQYVLPPSNFQYVPPQDQNTASADQYRAPVVVQKLEPEQWKDVRISDSPGN